MPERLQSERSDSGLKIDRQTVRELTGAAGAALAGYGAWMSYPPAGFMVAGGILVGLAVIGTLRGGR
ncbi:MULTISPECIES: hypothetical protein [Rhizobium]|uniref:Uncharacterized protein n=1 Tax=Rhizobium lentis TaxID=1138194 RepID=A0A7W8XEF6_9HYPH|nr:MULTISPECIES: hypothetical protein [Rhizobium]MBB4574399.1 hypothetical protein [Rhizobium lentis]MBB5550325.1 hypothetical protein [Rhizobium lentis]MBB5560646.1 hypothetical protein [Rhizobium lentis]MBB5567231.1 hypothetical protein [Rhizobium lentis]OWV67932.1 hypothetical protein ATY76_13470 [Rhizobium sp. R339]